MADLYLTSSVAYRLQILLYRGLTLCYSFEKPIMLPMGWSIAQYADRPV